MARLLTLEACPCRALRGAQGHEGLRQCQVQGEAGDGSPHSLALGKGLSEALQAHWRSLGRFVQLVVHDHYGLIDDCFYYL